MSATESPDAKRLGERFDPFHDPYLADPYPFFAEAQAATPVFYSPQLDYWVVTRYHDMRQVLQTPQLFSAVNALAPIQPICPGCRTPPHRRERSPRDRVATMTPRHTPGCDGWPMSPSRPAVSP